MIVTLPSGKLRIYFRHTNNEQGCWSYSECIIRNENNEVVSTGYSRCCPQDQFSFVKGRKLSLQRALLSNTNRIGFLRTERTIIWEQYYREHKDLERNRVKTQYKLVNSNK